METDIKTGTGDLRNYRAQVGMNLRMVREAQGWTVEQVATMADVKPQTVEKIENGVFNVPLDVLAQVADVLGCDLVFRARKV